jgi:hypothetical protein
VVRRFKAVHLCAHDALRAALVASIDKSCWERLASRLAVCLREASEVQEAAEEAEFLPVSGDHIDARLTSGTGTRPGRQARRSAATSCPLMPNDGMAGYVRISRNTQHHNFPEMRFFRTRYVRLSTDDGMRGAIPDRMRFRSQAKEATRLRKGGTASRRVVATETPRRRQRIGDHRSSSDRYGCGPNLRRSPQTVRTGSCSQRLRVTGSREDLSHRARSR